MPTLYAGTERSTMTYVQSHLDEDMELLAAQQKIRPSLFPEEGATSSDDGTATPSVDLHEYLLLQIVHVEDVSLSAADRLKTLSATLPLEEDSTATATVVEEKEGAAVSEELQEMLRLADSVQGNASPPTGQTAHRCLKFILTDGFRRLIAVERRRTSPGGPLFEEGITLGGKLRVPLPPTDGVLRRWGRPALTAPLYHTASGVLRLMAGETVWMGGGVRALQWYTALDARRQLQQRTGRPCRREEPNTTANNSNIAAPPPPVVPVPPTTPSTDTTLTRRPLSQWKEHQRLHPYTPFWTEIVIEEVVSDLVIAPLLRPEGTAPSHPSEVVFSLLVQVCSPETFHAADEPQAAPPPSSTEDDSLIIDLGNFWLEQLIGMRAAEFQALTQPPPQTGGKPNHDRVNDIIQRMGNTLQQLDTCEVVLVKRLHDGVVEVTDVRRVS